MTGNLVEALRKVNFKAQVEFSVGGDLKNSIDKLRKRLLI
jgi:hypothetical protein